MPDILLSKEEVDYDENTESTPAKGTLAAFMNLVERVCNRLPPPAILFVCSLS
ncbi:hypothetical protein M5E89_13260 [Acidaminococcus intestini]|nr:hypothetical protein M5E89_13260 [Acidaminococcus intestini]